MSVPLLLRYSLSNTLVKGLRTRIINVILIFGIPMDYDQVISMNRPLECITTIFICINKSNLEIIKN